MNLIEIEIQQGCIENFKHCYHDRGKSWIAKATVDLSERSGIARSFFPKASKGYASLPSSIEIGDILEFAGDYYSGSGKKNPMRCYCVVVEIQDDSLTLAQYDDIEEAEQHEETALSNDDITINKIKDLIKDLESEPLRDALIAALGEGE